LALTLFGCGIEPREDDGEGGGGSGGSGAGGGVDTQCENVACGEPCSVCKEPPCNQQVCDGLGTCRDALDVTCSPCEAAPPPDGNACEYSGLACEYDEGLVVACRVRSTCTPSGWSTVDPGCSSSPAQDPACPPATPSGNCNEAADPAICIYGDIVCGCTNCLGGPCGGQAQWVCGAVPASPCPPVAPKLGEPCYVGAGTMCTYGDCAVGGTSAGRLCQNGFWLDEPINCPL
jgi:hypothetical protein